VPADAVERRTRIDDLTVADVAQRLHVTPLTVRRWLKAGSLAGIECDDRADCRILERDLETFLDARRRGGVQERAPRPPRDT
jgi:excisionase family DNA binding protein